MSTFSNDMSIDRPSAGEFVRKLQPRLSKNDKDAFQRVTSTQLHVSWVLLLLLLRKHNREHKGRKCGNHVSPSLARKSTRNQQDLLVISNEPSNTLGCEAPDIEKPWRLVYGNPPSTPPPPFLRWRWLWHSPPSSTWPAIPLGSAC